MTCSSLGDVAGGGPCELDLISLDIGSLGLSVDAIHLVSVSEVPAASPLWLVAAELALEVGAVWIQPLATHELSILELSDVFLGGVIEDVGALAILLAISPVARVNVFVSVGHDSLSMALAGLPVAVVLAHLRVLLLADALLEIVLPLSLVSDWLLLGALSSVGVFSLSVSHLQWKQMVSIASVTNGMDYLRPRGSRQCRCLRWGRWQFPCHCSYGSQCECFYAKIIS